MPAGNSFQALWSFFNAENQSPFRLGSHNLITGFFCHCQRGAFEIEKKVGDDEVVWQKKEVEKRDRVDRASATDC